MRWVVLVSLCVDGLWKPERCIDIDAQHPLAAIRKALPEACRLENIPQRSERISSATIKTRRIY